MPAPANLVHQTSASTGTGNLTLAAVSGKQSFATAFSTGGADVFDYFISNRDAAEWERGTGHMSDSTTLVRDTVIESTNANAAVSFSAGTKDVVNDVPAAKQVTTDGTQTLTNKTLTAPAISSIVNTGTLTLPTSTDTLIGRATTDTLTNKTLTSPTLTTPALGTPSSGNLSNCTDLSTSAVGTAINAGTPITDLSDTDRLGVLDASASNALVPVAWSSVKSEIVTEVISGKETVWIPALAMTPRTTNGAASGTVEMTTNKNMFKTLDFDTTTQEFAQFEIHMPKSWNLSTVTFQPVWSHAATTTNFGVVWQLQGVARSDGDAGDVAFGTAQTSTDTGGTTNDIYIAPESSAITIAGTPAAGDTVQFQIARVPANGSDTMAIDARLHGIRLFYTTNAANDT